MFRSEKISCRTCGFKRNFLPTLKPTLAIVEKKPLRLVLPYLGPISLNAMKNTLNCCKLQVIFKS